MKKNKSKVKNVIKVTKKHCLMRKNMTKIKNYFVKHLKNH